MENQRNIFANKEKIEMNLCGYILFQIPNVNRDKISLKVLYVICFFDIQHKLEDKN